MFRFPSRNSLHLHKSSIFVRNSNGISIAEVVFLKSLSTFSPSVTPSTVDFFVNSIGLSPDSALAAANTIRGKSMAKSESVLAFFKHYGFSSAQIADILTRRPVLILSDPDKNLLPKFEFFSHSGFSRESLVNVVSADPTILLRSLEKQIKPCIGLPKSFYGNSSDIVSLFMAKRGTRVLHKFSEKMGPNIDTLRSHGVPKSGIVKMITVRPRALSWIPEDFNELVREIKEMGFNPSTLMFIHGVCALAGMKKDKWVAKFEAFKSFGWSDEEVRSLFLKQAKVMHASEEHLKRSLDFFMNKMGWSKVYISKYPTVLLYSFEKRVLPRSTVLQHLVLKGHLDKKSMGFVSMLVIILLQGKLGFFKRKSSTIGDPAITTAAESYTVRMVVVEDILGPS
ncbi:hypothetical protein FNV43_RR25438 [Rhamnella rubrinervis]|uniref:Uncharacterized protein n=1 Tax=Rhamnella rubrinervis TaxID=2594499 RepID=A0A8K0GU57_9ROSA|nr:hypothetical protein FNV43_RR25438 [Rhamnella rubrinervis]